MKRWILSIIALLIIGIGALVYNATNIDTEGYLELAETFRKRGAYDQEMFNLQKALERSIKVNGMISEQTAEIYRKLGNRETDLNKVEEYFDKAIGIYKIENEKKLPDMYYEKGYWLFNGGNATKVMARESFEEVVRLYEENQYENTNNLCMSLYYIAFSEEDKEQQFLYLKEAESHISELSVNQSWELSTIIERAIAYMLFIRGEYDLALSYCENIIEKAQEHESEKPWNIVADAKALSGACLAFLGKAEEGVRQLESAIMDFQNVSDDAFYFEKALAHGYLAVAYACMEPPQTQLSLDAGITAFSYYKQRNTITNIDMGKMEQLKAYVGYAYGKLYPEQDERDFEIWFEKNAKVTAYNYHFYTN